MPTHESWKEPAGFLCRWCLLALAGAGVLAAVCASLPAAAGAGEGEGAVLLPDTLCRPWPKMHLTAFLTAPEEGRVVRLLAVLPGRAPRYLDAGRGRMHVGFGQLAPGSYTVTLKGLPYSLHAFARCEAAWVVLRPEEPVVLIDARLAGEVLPAGDAQWQRLIAAAATAGRVALFHPGPVGQAAKDLRRLRPFHPHVPIVCDFRPPAEGDETYVLRRLSSLLGRDRPPPGAGEGWAKHAGLAVVTNRPDLAAEAARQQFRTHLLAPVGTGPPAGPHLVRHGNLGNLASFLAGMSDSGG